MKPNRTHFSKLTNLVLGLALLGVCAAKPASATIYQFAIPVSAIEALMPANYAAYDIYIRAAVTGAHDLCGCTGTTLVSPYNVNATPPVAPQAWTDVINGKDTDNDGIQGPGDTTPYQSIHFTYGPTSPISVIVKDSNSPGSIVGNTVNGKTVGSVVPNGSQFIVDISTPTAGLAGQTISLYVYGLADGFSAGYVGASASKGANFAGLVNVTAQLTPEPVSIFMGGSGLLLFALAATRRRRKSDLQA